MAFDDSLIGSNDFDPKSATEDLIRRTSDEPLPDVLDPRMLNTRLARKLGREPKAVAAPTPPKTDDKLDFSSQAAPAPNVEPSEHGDPNGLDFTSQVQQTEPAPTPGMNIGGPTALAKGLTTGAPASIGGAIQGAATYFGAGPGNPIYDFGHKLQTSDLENIQREGLGLPQKPPLMSDQERDSLTGRVGTMASGIAPYAIAAAAGGPAVGAAAGFAGLAADTYGKVFEDAKAKGADDATATTAAHKAAAAAGVLGALPLGTGKLASSIVGKIVSQGLTFAGTNEATEYVLQEIAKDYDPKAGYTPEAKRIIASLITGGAMGGLHSFERKPEQPAAGNDTTSPHDVNGPGGPGLNGPDPTMQGPDEARTRAEQAARDHMWGRGPDDAGAGAGPQPGPQGGPQPGGAKAKPGAGAKQAPPETEAAEGHEAKGEDFTFHPGNDFAYGGPESRKTAEQDYQKSVGGNPAHMSDADLFEAVKRAKFERLMRTFDRASNPSKMSDGELYNAVNEHLRDTSSSGATAQQDTPEEKAQREQHQTKQTEDADLKQAFPWMTDAQIQSMTPDMRAVWVNRARGAKPGSEDGNAPKSASTNSTNPAGEQPRSANVNGGESTTTQNENIGRREAPIVPKTADDVVAAQPVEPKSAAQAEAENYQHAHMELPHLGLEGQHSLSIETGVGQTRKGPPGPDGEPEWEVKMEHGAYGRIKGTRGADGQPLDIMVGPHPSSPHVFIINQHDPKTGQFDELKVQAGYRTPIDAMHAYANSYNDGAAGRIGGMVAMNAEQFHAWLRHGDHTKEVSHGDAKTVLARAFPNALTNDKDVPGRTVKRIASSPGLHNAGEEAHRPLTEAPTKAAVVGVPKGSLPSDAIQAIGRPAAITTPKRESFKAVENYSLLEFLADRGGLKPHPELEILGLGNTHRVQIPGKKGFFGLIKQDGWDIDTAREAAEEAHYIKGDSDDVTATPRHFLDAVDAELRGTKLYPNQGEGQRTKVKERLDAEREAYEQSRAQEIEDELNAAGYGEVAGELRQRALRHVTVGIDPDTAIQTAMAEMDAEHVLETPAEFDAIYGDGAYDEVLAGIPYEGGPTSSGQSSEDHWSYEDALDRTGARASTGSEEVRDRRSEEAADDQGSGRTETTAEGGPVRESARAEQRAAGRREAAGDETGDAARHQLAAEATDDTEGRVGSYDLDGQSAEFQAADSDETVTVTLTRKGPWDFNDTFPAPDPERLAFRAKEGRTDFDHDPPTVEDIAGSVDESMHELIGEVGAIRQIDRKIADIRSGKTKLKKNQKPQAIIEALQAERKQAADAITGIHATHWDMFGREAANAMVKEARYRVREEETLPERAAASMKPSPKVEPAAEGGIPGKVAAAVDDERGNPIVETGAVFKTASGRETSPAPKIDTSTDRRTKKAIFSLNSWLLDEARKEVAGNDYQSTLLRGLDPKNMTQSDQDTVNSLLFGDPDGPRPSDLVRVDGKKTAPKAKSVDDLTEAEKKAHRDAPTWAQVLHQLPMHKDGRTREHEIAFDIIKEITGKKKAPKFDDLTPEQKGELYERVKARKPVAENIWQDFDGGVKPETFMGRPVPENAVPFKHAKAGDTLVDGSFVVERKIDRKGWADTLARQEGGYVSLDGPKHWAVLKRPAEPVTEPVPVDIAKRADQIMKGDPNKFVAFNDAELDANRQIDANFSLKKWPKEAEDAAYAAARKAFLNAVVNRDSLLDIKPLMLKAAEEAVLAVKPEPATETGADNKPPETMRRFELGRRIGEKIGSAALRPSKEQLEAAAKAVGVTPAEARRALDAFNNPEGINASGRETVAINTKPVTEIGADNKQQTVLPGAEKAADKTMAQRGADAPLKPKANQKPADDGLFGDGHKQTDLLDMVNAKPKPAPRDELDDALDQAINEHRAKPLSMDDVAKGLTAIFGKKKPGDTLSDQTESLDGFSEETYAQALPYFKAGMSQVANAGDLLSMARALVSQLAGAGMDVETITAMKPYMRRFMDDVRSGKETINAPSRGEVLERDRSNAAPENGVGAADVPAAAGGAEQGAGSRGGEADAGDQRPATGERLPQDYAPVVGERGHLEIPEREPVVDDRDAAAPESERSADGGSEGFQFDQRADGEAEEAAQRTADLNARRAAQQAADKKNIPFKWGRIDNIRESLPMLFPEQHEDVQSAEIRFNKTDGHGMLFTNGTGTGKTFSGLGIIKRFFQKGTPNTLVIAPSQGILLDWQKAARSMGLEAHILDSTVDKGKGGLNLTTYANLGNNPTLADREWDLVTADEAHNLSSNQDGTTTDALRTLRALTYHPDGLQRRAEMVLRDLFDRIGKDQEKPSPAFTANRNRAIKEFNAKAEPLIASWKDRARPKAAFLSATPFAYHFSLDWAEGYLFEHDRSKDSNGGYNAPTGRDAFYMQHLGYRKRVGKLTKPDAEVKQEVMERQLHEYLKKTGSLAGRMLTVDKDYDRKFILAHDAVGNQIDQALNFLQDNEEFRPLLDHVSKKFDYLTRMRLLEAIKARSAIDYINQSLALGRKVVVFHDYNEGGGINPFDLTFSDDAKTTRYRDGKHEDVELKPLYEDFIRQNPYVKELKFSSYGPPLQTLTGAFPKALTYNGTVSKKKRDAAKTLFNDDNSGHDLIIVQSAAGEAGISLHDTTGKHQRVVLNLGMPIRPVSSIQQEGRIYRVGQASDALFRYMNTGTDWERWTFAGKIAERAGTAENLALGNQARTIRQAFIDAFANADDNRPEPGEGTGGKEADRAVTHSMSEFEKAKTHYYAQSKVKGRRDQREGTDYYATPEPLGLKMVEWANVKSGEKMLEPSAGHGAIARYFPEDTHRTLVEPSSSLASRASLNSPGARVVADRFENLDTAANKFDAIVMNPPFGSAGATAIEHIAKAAKHLKNGGRIVALIPRGSTDAKFDKFMDSPAANGIYQVADVILPGVTFERAGTSISARVVVLEKQTDPEVAQKLQQQSRDYSNAETVGELFDAIEHSEIRGRLEPKTKDVDAPAEGRITIEGVELGLTAERDGTAYADLKNKLGIDKFKQVMRAAEANDGYYLKTAKTIKFKTAADRQKFLEALANPPAPPEAPTAPSGVTFKTAETVHGKTGANVFVAVPDQRVERDIYNQLVTTAKGFGGYYSSFKGGNAIPGFQFTSDASRAQFIAKLSGDKLGSPAATLEPYEGNERADTFRAFEARPNAPRGLSGQAYTLQRGRETDNEQMIAFDRDGNVVGDKLGTKDEIILPADLNALIRTPGADVVVHHNHPSGRSLSHLDIQALANPGLSTVWAHAHNGYVYAASLTDKAKARMPEDIVEGKNMLVLAYLRAEKIIKDVLLPHLNSISADDPARPQLSDELNEAWHQMVNSVLAAAGITNYRTNYSVPPSVYNVPGLSEGLKAAIKAAKESFFDISTKPIGSPDRYTHSVRHPGNMGVVFDRVANLPRVRRKATDAGARPRNDRGKEADGAVEAQLRLLDTLPGLDDSLGAIDYTLNDILGKRLLGRLGDLNATEMRVQLQDKFARVKNLEEDKGNRDTALSAYQAESLYYGRTGQRLESLGDHHVDPIIREMKGRDIPSDMMDKFLYAKHAPERNRVVGELYPDGHDFKRATVDPTVKGASGMSNGEAASFIGRLRADGKLADYEAVARMVYALNYRTLQNLFNYGLIDRDTFEQLIKIYKYYVPLRGWQEGGDEGDLPHAGKGMDTRAKSFKQAFGRKTLAASPLAYSIMQAEQAIVKGEKNKVGNVFLKFALANPDPDLWTINRPEPRKYVSKVTGMATSSPTWDMNDARTFVTRVNGRANLIQFKGADGANLARALKDMGSANVHSAVRMMAAVTHTMARLATAWNPEFMIPNLVRDVGEAFINLGEQRQRAFVRKFAGHILPAMKGSWMAIAEKTAAPGSSAQTYIDAFHEFDREGGRVRFFGIDDPDVIEKNVEKRLKRLSGGAVNSIKDLGDKAGKALEVMGGGIENATRLAAYMAAKDVGMSAPDAAMLARNLTVNFNKKGELGTAIGSAYMFANAGVQGQARMLRALHPKNRRVWMAVGALATAGVMSTSFNIGIGGYDKAGVANYMKIPSWERDKNIIIMGPGETYGKIPLPYGFAPFHVLGSHATTVLMGQEKPAAAAAAVFGSIASAFNPLGEEEALITTLAPTTLRPAVHIHYNENWTGKPLYPARDADKGKPESRQSFRSDTAASKAVAEGLNSLTGGDHYRPGAIDIHPGSLDHVMGAITGGVGKFFKNIVDTVVNGWNGQPWEASKTPILRRFVGKLDHNLADSAAYYDARKDATEDANRIRQAKRDIKSGADEQAARAFLEATPGGRQKIIFDRADKQMRRLRTEEERVNNSPQPYEAKKAALDAIRLQMRDVQNRARAESARLKGQDRLYVSPTRSQP